MVIWTFLLTEAVIQNLQLYELGFLNKNWTLDFKLFCLSLEIACKAHFLLKLNLIET